jgi:hypothetical protein
LLTAGTQTCSEWKESSGLTLPPGFDGQTYACGGFLPLEGKGLPRQIVRTFEEDDGAAPLGSRFFIF